MVKHNNVIPKAHFKKKWRLNLKTGFDQPLKKKRRYQKRKQTSSVLLEFLKKPKNFLRPLVHCPTKLNNMKIKIGRGFSKNELSKNHLGRKDAFSLGISFDKRRRSKKLSENFNFQRLSDFLEGAVFQKKKNNLAFSDKKEPLFFFNNKISKGSQELKKNQVGKLFHTEEIKVDALRTLRKRKKI